MSLFISSNTFYLKEYFFFWYQYFVGICLIYLFTVFYFLCLYLLTASPIKRIKIKLIQNSSLCHLFNKTFMLLFIFTTDIFGLITIIIFLCYLLFLFNFYFYPLAFWMWLNLFSPFFFTVFWKLYFKNIPLVFTLNIQTCLCNFSLWLLQISF